MGQGARATAVAAPVAVLVSVLRADLGLGAAATLLLATAALAWVAAPESSPLRRGWWVVALAGMPAALASLPGAAPPATRPALAVVAALLVVVAVILATPARDPAEARESLIEALLAGGLVAFALAATPGVVAAGSASLLVVAGQTAALWLVLCHPGVLGMRRPGPPRLLAAGLVMLLIAEVAHLVGGPVPAASIAAPATAAALALWALALAHREATAPPPYRARGRQRLDAGRVSLVLLGVLAGPGAVALVGLAGGPPSPTLALGGAVLALLAVLHLLHLVADRGRRAWRAQHDALTGLPTEPLFEDRLRQAMATARRADRGLAVAFVDLDGFKQVNDRDGHEAGDAVLRIVADRLRGALREQDTVARRSGDEFLVLLPDVPDELAAEIVAEKLLGVLAEPIDVADQQHRVGASIGLALWPRDGVGAEDLVRHADAAMYESKVAGRGRVRWYSTTTSARSRLRLTLAQQLEQALGTAALELDHQPRVDLRDGSVVGLVSLVRWRHPDLGLLPPAAFLPIAAEVGLSDLLDRHVLERACSQAARWARMGWLDVPVMVHLSDAHTAVPELEERVVRALAAGGLAPRRLRVAVTEDGLRRGGPVLVQTIADLAELGVGTVVTRFGSGDAGLGRLAETRLGGLEIASPHVSRLPRGRAPVVEAAVDLAGQLRVEVSGNGVDGEVELDRLRGLGVAVGRGRHLSRPLTRQELDVRLATLAAEPGHDPRRIPVSRLAPDPDVVGAPPPQLAAVVRDVLRHDTHVEPGALTEVLRRVTRLPAHEEGLVGDHPPLRRHGP
jgi:diguanylate cyclase (GGDEF)-like protein